jgi:hypothetical protein
MKTLKNILLIAAVVTGTVVLAKAEPLYSPKGQEHADAFRKAPISSTDVNLAADRPVGNAKAWEAAQSLNKVGSASSVDLAHAPRPALTAKDPGYDVAWRDNAMREFQIAPVK